MSKLSKLIFSPKKFFQDADISQVKELGFSAAGYIKPWKRTAFVFNVAKWKRRLLKEYFPSCRMHYMALRESIYNHHLSIKLSVNPVFIVWGMNQPDDLADYAIEFNIPIIRVEDGFIRSIGLGADHNLPYSLCIDETGIYFDSSRPSDLENILNNYKFEGDQKLMEEARSCLADIRAHQLSKYNEVYPPKAELLYGPKVKRRILVIGQVEDDQSLLYGCDQIMTNVQLIKLAAQENPDAQIIYKTHPDIIAGKRTEISNPNEVSHLAEIIRTPLTFKDALHEIDRVYTLTSLAGFEALVHGVPVTTVGAPFYSGWGLTDDRQLTTRRNRKLNLEELFSGAYLLYPRYYDPKKKSFSTLGKVIEDFKDQLSRVNFPVPEAEFDRLSVFNFATKKLVSSRYIYNSIHQSIVIVSDSVKSLVVAKGLAAKDRKVTILFTRDALANAEDVLLTYEESLNITISSMHKRYSIAMSEIEANAVGLARAFSSDLACILSKLVGKHMPASVIEALMVGLDDYIYFEALRFYAAEACLKEFDSVVLLMDKCNENLDVVQSFAYHAKNSSNLGKVYFSTQDEGAKQIIEQLFSSNWNKIDVLIDEAAMASEFSSFWHDLQDERFDEYSALDDYIAVCGNVSMGNYAYFPASMKLIESLAKKSDRPLLFYSSSLLGVGGQEEVKKITLSEQISPYCTVYNGCHSRYQDKYPKLILDRAKFFDEKVTNWFFATIEKRLPSQCIDIFRPRLNRFIRGLFVNTIFIAESMRSMERCSLFATAMDRSMVSRILSAIADIRSIPSIGIQPQIISSSPRYLKPAVRRMGVIDDAQVDVFESLGASRSNLAIIGSINILARLIQMDECAKLSADSMNPRRVLFAMQHSNAHEMISTSIALRDISRKLGIEVVVKPHPHQELPVLHEVRRIFGRSDNIKVLSRDSDTYVAAANCGIVVGLFSSVLLEAALSGKPVVVVAFKELHASIDFSVRGLALKVHNADELEANLTDILNDGPLLTGLRTSIANYLTKNPQFEKPYSQAYIDRFVESALT